MNYFICGRLREKEIESVLTHLVSFLYIILCIFAVAPHAGAWIEIGVGLCRFCRAPRSHPTWVRKWKYIGCTFFWVRLVTPTRMHTTSHTIEKVSAIIISAFLCIYIEHTSTQVCGYADWNQRGSNKGAQSRSAAHAWVCGLKSRIFSTELSPHCRLVCPKRSCIWKVKKECRFASHPCCNKLPLSLRISCAQHVQIGGSPWRHLQILFPILTKC